MSAELLTERMREAARVIEEAAAEYHRRSPNGAWLARDWTASDLDQFADAWEAEDREAEERKAQIDELASMISTHLHDCGLRGINVASRGVAQKIVAAGFRNAS